MMIRKLTEVGSTFIKQRLGQAFCMRQSLLATACVLLSACAQSPHGVNQELVPQAHTAVSDANQLEAQFQQVVSEMEAGDYVGAEEVLFQLVSAAPSEAVYWANYALSQYKNGNFQAALLSADTCLGLQPTLGATINLKAVLLIELGKVPEAEKLMLDAVAKYPGRPQLYYNLALVYDTYFQDASNAAVYYQHYLDIVKDDTETARWLTQVKVN